MAAFAGELRRTTVATREELADILAGFALFGDLQTPQLLGVAGVFEETVFPQGERILRQGLTGSGFFIILEGSADVVIDGTVRGTLHRGDFFGEVSILLGEPPTADVVAQTQLRCIAAPGPAVQPFLLAYPHVMFRMLQAQARRLRNANRWRS
jgi:CRP-like cAMP-binding protein